MENYQILPILEPLLGISLALNLAYLNLPIFSFLTTISAGVNDKISSLSDLTKRHVSQTPWYKDAIEISKVRSLEKLEFNDGMKLWMPFKSTTCAVLFNLLFRYRVGKFLSLLATVLVSLMIVSGVGAQIWPDDVWVKHRASIFPSPFKLALFSFIWPVFCIGSGSVIRFLTIRELNYNLRNLGVEAVADISHIVDSAKKAVSQRSADDKASGKVMLGN